jgi:ribosome biogenesis GTPase
MRGLIIQGSRNVFIVKPEDSDPPEVECRIKGKVLKGTKGCSNPLAPGDWVIFESDPAYPERGLILGMEERRNALTRRNQKALGPQRPAEAQVIAANVDALLCVTTPFLPPFRPRFLDRILTQGEIAGIPALIVCNKSDLGPEDPDVEERLSDFVRIGYPVVKTSARTGLGLDVLRKSLKNRFSVLLGQSGVGKSSLVNALAPSLNVRVGRINEKYDRGSHTTVMSRALEIPGEARTVLIDTPGLRRFSLEGIPPEDVILYMPEFASLAGRCAYGRSCSHRTEPGCKVMEAVAAGVIHEDRYESFLRIQDELKEGGGG